MKQLDDAGQIVILNGPPRSGKSSIAVAVQARFDCLWMNLGVDHFKRMTPARFQPGIGPDRVVSIPILSRLWCGCTAPGPIWWPTALAPVTG